MASSIPQRYIDGLNSADVNAVSELFSQGSQFLGGDGSKRVGRKAIHDFYANVFANRKTLKTSLGRVIDEGRRVAFEVIVHDSPMGANGQANSLDLVELDDDGLIAHKVVFYPQTRVK